MSVRLEREGSVARIVLDRPERLNALTGEMIEQLAHHCQEITLDRSVRAVLLSGEGRAFCAGADVGSMSEYDLPAGRARIRHAHRAILALANLEKPLIAAVRGATVGVGWSLALTADVIIASDNARFGLVFKKVGLAPDGGACYFLARYMGVLRAKELMMSARLIDAAEARQLGLVTELAADAELDARATAWASELAQSATFALAMGKRLFSAASRPSLEEFLEFETHVQSQVLHTADRLEGVTAFREKRAPTFHGH